MNLARLKAFFNPLALGVAAFFVPVIGLLLLLLVDGLLALWPGRLHQVDGPNGQELVLPARALWRVIGQDPVLVRRGLADVIGQDMLLLPRAKLINASQPKGAVRVQRFNASGLFGYIVAVCVQARCEPYQGALLEPQSQLRLRQSNGELVLIAGAEIARIDPLNDLAMPQRVARWLRALLGLIIDAPRNANTEGGMGSALVGTSLLVILMSAMVSPLGVLAALYLYRQQERGRFARAARVAISNLAAVPSVLYGAFALVAFVYGLGGWMDAHFFAERLPSPTFGTGGLLWAACAMALLTLPIVVTITLEGLERVPQSLIEASLALGATREETLLRLVLPLARGAFLTGLILAISRAAGEIAPLMLVGVVKSAPQLPLTSDYPYIHLEQKFMHLGHQLFDLAVHSPSLEAATPMLLSCGLLLLLLVLGLNSLAYLLRARLIRGLESMSV